MKINLKNSSGLETYYLNGFIHIIKNIFLHTTKQSYEFRRRKELLNLLCIIPIFLHPRVRLFTHLTIIDDHEWISFFA